MPSLSASSLTVRPSEMVMSLLIAGSGSPTFPGRSGSWARALLRLDLALFAGAFAGFVAGQARWWAGERRVQCVPGWWGAWAATARRGRATGAAASGRLSGGRVAVDGSPAGTGALMERTTGSGESRGERAEAEPGAVRPGRRRAWRSWFSRSTISGRGGTMGRAVG
jgi:hypothetical protein